ncbi:DUF2975 domain-containing protein [Brevundimonas sp. AAP58]|uniref:DUF2975 domain-containing protein n=1 Tax=Brevundimonas sp. AAP58 TaxID=1523422 RepID=UPI000AC18E70|nr:DUF2975 domain-containing protein [Brevundimonas sp. AAP58]
MGDAVATARIETQSRNLARILSWTYWVTAFWLFAAMSYVPLKRLGAALVSAERDALASVAAFSDVVVEALPVIFALIAVYTLRRLFVQFADGQIFIPSNGRRLTRAGDWLIASAAAALIISPTIGRAAGIPVETVGFNYSAVVLALVGLAIRLFGRTFELAADIKADNDQMV